ncbi:octopamine receptor-like [Schistocerca nitens]|uniref:octopamine receptor-like n=1 Tax=Schistocerca nitens TaxID=7011 RepID=UPI0021173A1B|nr:octopamine receptor-like [Schistocerca nitens]
MDAGNTLIIAAVVTTRRLRTVTNCFVMSLAVADWLVGLFVMPLAVAYHVMGKWHFGWEICQVWISLDVLLCTASILSLCAISVDRYLAVTQPLNYSRRRRSKKLALLMILVVWVLAVAITCPPILGCAATISESTLASQSCNRHRRDAGRRLRGDSVTPMLSTGRHLSWESSLGVRYGNTLLPPFWDAAAAKSVTGPGVGDSGPPMLVSYRLGWSLRRDTNLFHCRHAH